MKKKSSKAVRYNKWGYIFLIPFILVYVVFQLIPLFNTIYNSFFENYLSGLTQIGPNFVGLENYKTLFTQGDIWIYAKNTMILWIMCFVPQIILSLLLGAWFSDVRLKLKGSRFFKTVIYLPNLIMASAFSMLFFTLFSDGGPINSILMQIGIISEPYKFLANTGSARGLIALMNCLMWFGNTTILLMAGMMGIPTLIQEQNSYAGVTNKLLAKKACKICVAYEGMERFFDKEKIILTGNPVRQGLLNSSIDREKAIQSFGLDPQKKTILIVGGSLGARTINNCVMQGLEKIKNSGVQFIWQTGKFYINEAKATVAKAGEIPMLHTTDFISDMAAAYTAADLVISRAGAGSISEFCLLQKPVILVPSPNVAEDHQTKNALALVNKGAALYVKDSEATQKLLDLAIATVSQPDTLKNLSMNIAKLAFKDSANVIANEVYKLAVKYKKEHER
mgnify:CR=1 FL=1